MNKQRVLVIASGNQGKILEFRGLLSHLHLDVRPQPADVEVEETGTTFAATNARQSMVTLLTST